MANVSERLQRARKDAGLTLHQVADQTRIQHWILEAIERDDLSHVPGGVFIRGYLISFARAVGLDGERVWADYRAEMRTAAAELAPDDSEEPPSGGVSRWTIVAIAAAVLVAAVVWHNRSRSNPDIVAVPPPVRTATPEPQPRAREVLPAAAATSGPAAEAVAAVDPRDALPTSPAPLIVKMHASSDVWMDAKVDGEQRVYRLVMAGEDVSLGALNQIVLLVGDASAVTYEINGMPGRALGAAGAVRELVITPANYTTFVDGSR